MLASWTRPRARHTRPSLESLESRLAPAVGTSYVNDNWAIINDADTSGTLTPGDTVRNDNDTTNPGTIVGVFGTDAFSSINDAIAGTAAFGTVNVLEGTYTENVIIDKNNLTLRSIGGSALTTITGISDGSLGAVEVAANTNDVTIGQAGAGFTINGIDNPSPGSESAAVYLQGDQSGTTVRGNVILAGGDEAILSEFGATVSNVTIDANTIGGQTFTGTAPAGDGSSAQFTLANVPRQLVVLSGGSGGGNTSNVTFTNNLVNGIAGGISTTDNTGATVAAHEQGNNLVSIDSNGATISGNTFAGTTNRFSDALRARGPSSTISGNTFDSTNMTPTTAQVEIASTGQTLDQIAAANTFDKYVFVPGGSTTGLIGLDLQTYINAVPAGTTLQVLGTFPGDITVNKALTLNGDFGATGAITVTDPGAVINGAVTAGNGLSLVSGSTLVETLTNATTFGQSSVTGTVALNGATLQVNSAFTPGLGQSFTIIQNDGTDAVTGTFANLPEGAAVPGTPFTISYKGGDGNDVVLSTAPAPVRLAIGGVVNGTAQVAVLDPSSGQTLFTLTPFVGYGGAVKLAQGDVNGDGVNDIIVVNAVGQANVAVFDGKTGGLLRSFLAFPGYLGGVNLAAGDVDGDTVADIVVSTTGGTLAQVAVYSGTDGTALTAFTPYAGYDGAVLVAVADVPGDSTPDIITLAVAAGHVRAFDGSGMAEAVSFIDSSAVGAVSLAAGERTAGHPELFLGGSSGKVTLIDATTQAIQSLTPFPGYLGALSVAAVDLDGDGLSDLATASAQGAGDTRTFDEALTRIDDFFAFGMDFTGGVTVG